MWAQYGWLIWVLFGGLFLFLMFRGGGCCAGHGGRGGRRSGGHEELDEKTSEGTTPRDRSRTGCH